VKPGLPHHITQRGVRRMPVFFSDDDRWDSLGFLFEQGKKFGVQYGVDQEVETPRIKTCHRPPFAEGDVQRRGLKDVEICPGEAALHR